MLDLSTEFKQEMYNDNRNFSPFLDITLVSGKVLHITKEKVWENTFKIEDATSSQNKFTIGAAVTGKLKVTLNNIYDDFSDYDFSDATVIAYVGLQLSDTLEKVRVGTFIVDEPSYNGSTITLSCIDYMSKFDKPYSNSKLSYPATISAILADACSNCGISMLSANIPNGKYTVKNRPDDKAMTFGDIVAMAVQISGCWAKMDAYGRLKLDWYNMSAFEINSALDGGTFQTTTKPYSDGDDADGGNFKDYSSGDNIDGGTFTDQKTYHHIFSTKSFDVCTDDVVITGVKVTEEFNETDTQKKATYLAGKEGYVIEISGNDLIQEGTAKTVATYLYKRICGMRFRPLTVSTLGNPAVEAGDVAYVTDRKQNTYQAFISTRTFTLGGSLNISCDSETPLRNKTTQFTQFTKAVVKARNESKKQLSSYDLAVQQLTNLMTQSFGVFKSEEILEDGSIVYYMHNKPERATSSTIWKMTADALAVSTDGGKTWNAGIDSSGNAVVNVLNAIGINADWINAGEITGVSINIGNGVFVVDKEGAVTIKSGNFNIGGGVFSVDSNGNLTSKSASISGGDITLSSDIQYDSKLNLVRTYNGKTYGSVNLAADLIKMTSGTGTCINITTSGSQFDSLYIGKSDTPVMHNYSLLVDGDASIKTDLIVSGTKSRVVNTENYKDRLLYCYETPSPMFGDIGEGNIDETGKCYVYIDDVFAETIDTEVQYQVFLQKYGDGSIYVSERTPSYFVVSGTPNMKFGWELKAIQREYDTMRLEESSVLPDDADNEDSAAETYNYLTSLLYDVESEEVS